MNPNKQTHNFKKGRILLLNMEVLNEGKDVVCILYFRGQILYYWC